MNSRQMHLLVTANVNAIVSVIEHDFTEQETGCFSRFLFGIQLASANQRQGGAADYAAVAKFIVVLGAATCLITNAIHVKHVRKIDMTEALKNRE